jgi:hypothetical protein
MLTRIMFASALAMGLSTVAAAQEPMPDTYPPATAPAMPEEMDDANDEPTPVAPSPAPVEPKIITPIVIDNDDDDADVVARPVAPRPFYDGGAAAVKVLAGTGDFTQQGAREATGIGPSWDVRGVFGAHSPVGLEAAYVGSTRALTGSTIFGGNQLMSNGAEADLRIAAPVKAAEGVDVRPFAFGGVGWQYMSVWGDGAYAGAPSTDNEGDNILTIPAGVGIELGVGALNLDVRGTYRHAIDSEVFGDAGYTWEDGNALHSYNVSAGLGFEF